MCTVAGTMTYKNDEALVAAAVCHQDTGPTTTSKDSPVYTKDLIYKFLPYRQKSMVMIFRGSLWQGSFISSDMVRTNTPALAIL